MNAETVIEELRAELKALRERVIVLEGEAVKNRMMRTGGMTELDHQEAALRHAVQKVYENKQKAELNKLMRQQIEPPVVWKDNHGPDKVISSAAAAISPYKKALLFSEGT